MTIAEQARLAEDPYAFGFARFALRTLDRENQQVTFTFNDESKITFQIRYEVASDE